MMIMLISETEESTCKKATQCFESVMKKVPNEDWKQGKKQEWVAADFGDCKNLKFKVIIKAEKLHDHIDQTIKIDAIRCCFFQMAFPSFVIILSKGELK